METIKEFNDNPYFKVALKGAAMYLDEGSEKSKGIFAMMLGGLLISAPVRSLADALEAAEDAYAIGEKPLRYLSSTCERARDELSNVMYLGGGDMKDAATSLVLLQDALDTIDREEERYEDD